jgi:hypothetical protein
MSKLIARIRVLLKAAPAQLVAATSVVTIVVDETGKVLPHGWQDNAAQIGGVVLIVLGAATAIVRRVTPVIESERGLLPAVPPEEG